MDEAHSKSYQTRLNGCQGPGEATAEVRSAAFYLYRLTFSGTTGDARVTDWKIRHRRLKSREEGAIFGSQTPRTSRDNVKLIAGVPTGGTGNRAFSLKEIDSRATDVGSRSRRRSNTLQQSQDKG